MSESILDSVDVNSLTIPTYYSVSDRSYNNLPVVDLYKPLVIDRERFMDAYNLDLSDYVDRHTQRETAMKGGKQIMYLSYSHAYRLFRSMFQELEVDCVRNPQTGGFVHGDIDNRTWYIMSYVHNGRERTALYYFPILNTLNGMGIFPDEMRRKDGKILEGKYIIDGQLINKCVQRAIVKAIALTTGLGLKLWTGDGLEDEIVDEKMEKIGKLHQYADAYKSKTGNVYDTAYKLTYMSTNSEIERVEAELKALVASLKNKPVEQSIVQESNSQDIGQVSEPVVKSTKKTTNKKVEGANNE